MWNLFYRHTRLLILTLCLLFFWGLTSYFLLPRMEDPQLTQRAALITTRFPGASPERVESLVTEVIEEELLEIEEIETIDSTSTLGLSTIAILLDERVSAVDRVWSRVRDRLNDVASVLPQEALAPLYQDIDTRAYTMLVCLSWNLDSPASYAILSRLAQDLEQQFQTLKGTDKIEIFGAPDEEIVVEISPADLTALGLTPQGLSRQIQLSDAKVSAGQLYSPSSEILIEMEAELDSLERIRQIPINDSQSGLVLLGDIAQVSKGVKNPPSEMVLVSDRPAVVIAVLIDPKQRIDRWAESAYQAMKEFRATLPSNIDLAILFDQSKYVETRLNGLLLNLLLGALCVVGTTFFMMGWKPALIVSSTLPLSMLMVFGGMRALAIPLHQMSVTGLVIALGLLIDNAVVVVDEVQSLLKRGVEPKNAVSQSVRYLALPLFASTATTILAFLPIVLLPGSTGEFVRTIALSVILALLSSLFLSLTIVPALVGKLYPAPAAPRPIQLESITIAPASPHWWDVGFSHPNLTWSYRRFLDSVLSYPLLGVVLALILPVAGFTMSASLKEQFFPPAERDQIYVELELQSQASLAQTSALARQASQVLKQQAQVKDVHWFIGTHAPAFYYNLPRGGRDSASNASALVQLGAPGRPELIETLQSQLDRAFPAASILVKQLEQGPEVGAPIELRLYGPDLELLRELGNQVRADLVQIADVTHTGASLAEALPKLALEIDEEKAQLAGLNRTEIAEQLNANLEGSLGGSVLEGTEELPVRVRLSNASRGSLAQITSLEMLPETLTDEDDRAVPLSAIAQMQLVPQLAVIPRRNGQRVNTVQGFVAAGVLPSKVLAQFKQHLETSNFRLPPGYSYEFGGESAERNQAVSNLMSTVGVLLVVMIATLVLTFGSFRAAGIIVIVAISSVGLGLASLWLFDYPLGFMAILGTVGLVGVAINDSIVVLAALRSDPKARVGNRAAMREVIVHSTRHVLTTTITTVAGFIPLLLSGGEFWSPLAICVAGGVGGATLLALFCVPCLYVLSASIYRRTRRNI